MSFELVSGSQLIPKNYKIDDINNDNKIPYVYQFINGEYRVPSSKKYFKNINPSTNECLSYVACGNDTDIELAYNAALNAFPLWSMMKQSEREEYLFKIGNELSKRVNEFAILESRDNGKSITMSTEDVNNTINLYKFHGSAPRHALSSSLIENNNKDYNILDYVYYKPIGVVASIIPWNYPLDIFTEQVAPAIVWGNCIIIKPSELTPMTAYLMTDVFKKVGLPPGVVNVVQGFGSKVGNALCVHSGIRALSFVGGIQTGRKINLACAPTFKKVKLEMGGKNATIILNDAYFDEAIEGAAWAAFGNQGQICVCGSKLFIQSGIYDKFLNKFIQYIKKEWHTTIGNPLNNKTITGPLISKNHLNKIKKYINIAKKEGGNILIGGTIPTNIIDGNKYKSGNFYLPTVITGLDSVKSRCATEEIFGPIVTVHKFDNISDVIKIVNSLNYGLSGSVFTKDIKLGHKISQNIDSGRIWVNYWGSFEPRMPFGGIKHSGPNYWCRDFWTNTKHISCKL